MNRILILLASLILVGPVYAAGFNVDGFQQGMSLEDVQKVAKSRGSYLKREDSTGGYEVSYGERTYRINFCEPEGGVIRIAYIFGDYGDEKTRLMTFIRMTKQLADNHNIDIANANVSNQIGYDSKENASIDLSLAGDPDWSLTLTLFISEEWGVHNSQATFESSTDKCP